MSHDQVLQKVGEIQALHPDWDPNDIYEALCVTNFNNAQAILKLMIQDKSRKATIEPSPRKSESESPFAAVGMIQQQYYKEQREKREQAGLGTIVDYFDRNNNSSHNNRSFDDNIGFPSDEENNYYDDDFQTNEKNNTSTISSPKKKSNPPNLQRSRDNRQQNHVAQAQYAYTAKEKPAKKSSATQSQISSYVRSNNTEAANKPQTSYKSQYGYFGSGFTLRSKSNVHSKVENSSRKRKRSKFLDDFWNSDEEELYDVYAHNSSYNSDSDNSSINKHRKKSPSEKIQTFKSKYFQQKSHEQIDDDKIDKNNDQNEQNYQEERIHNEPEENYQYDEQLINQHAAVNRHNVPQVYAENYQGEHDAMDNNNNDDDHYQYENEAQIQNQNYDEEMPQEEQQQCGNHDAQNNEAYQEEEYNEEYFEDHIDNNNRNNNAKISKEIDAKIGDIDEEGPSLFIPTITIDSETPDPIVVSDSDSSQLTAPTTNSSLNSNNPIVIDSSPIRNESSEPKKNTANNKNDVRNTKNSGTNNNNMNTNPLDDEMAYFLKIKNATANKRRKIILD